MDLYLKLVRAETKEERRQLLANIDRDVAAEAIRAAMEHISGGSNDAFVAAALEAYKPESAQPDPGTP